MTNVQNWLTVATKLLSDSQVPSARLDALILLEDELGKDRSWILAHLDTDVSQLNKKFTQNLQRRAAHEPLAYIRGKCEFYGREFMVNKRVLVPRPESETMIELFKKQKLPVNAIVADVGSGSGALGITAALEKPGIEVNFIDIDKDTLAIANANARRRKVKGQYYQGDLLEAWPTQYDALLCNLPYVPDSFTINDAALIEPKIAIFGGEDGLDLYRRLFKQLRNGSYGKPVVFTESLPFQHSDLRNIAAESDYIEQTEDDFIQVFIR